MSHEVAWGTIELAAMNQWMTKHIGCVAKSIPYGVRFVQRLRINRHHSDARMSHY